MTPLTCRIQNDKLIIEVGLDVLAFATENHPELFDDEGEGRYAVTDRMVFAKEVVSELLREEEDGTTRISAMLDTAILNAISNGAEGVEEKEDIGT